MGKRGKRQQNLREEEEEGEEIENEDSDEGVEEEEGNSFEEANSEEDEDEEDDDEDGFDDMEEIPLDSSEAKNMSLKRQRPINEEISELPSAKQPKLSKADLLRPPTNKEINTLRETENLFHSNLFRLQIEEMLNEVKLKEKHEKLINKWIDELSTTVKAIPNSDSYSVSDLKWLEEFSVSSPFTLHQQDPKTLFRFMKPDEIKAVGSFALGVSGSRDTVVDIAVQMPRDCFKHGDHINYRYHRKRALYLAYLAAHLKDKIHLVETLSYEVLMGDVSRPVLVVVPSGKVKKICKFRLLAVPPPGVFPRKKLLPSKNAVRPGWWSGETGKTDDDDETEFHATPHYNMGVLSDLIIAETEESRNEALRPMKNVLDACHLFRVWLKQRELEKGYSSFSLFVLTSFIAHLVRTKKVTAHMSSYQVFRTVLLQLARSDWTKASGENANFFEHYEVVFLNETRDLNFCAQLSLETYSWVRWEAGVAVACLNRGLSNSFDSLFMIRKPFVASFDNILRIKNISEIKADEPTSDYAGLPIPAVVKKISAVIRKGLGKRIHLLAVQGFNNFSCGINESFSTEQELRFGLIVNPVEAWNVLVKGPPADKPEAVEFRNFWGEKSQLRRFQDGMVSEAVYTPVRNLKERRLLTRDLVLYLLEKHLNITKGNIIYVADQLETVLDVPKLNRGANYGTGEEFTQKAVQALDALSKNLRKLENLPLTITQVQGVAATLRHTETFPSLPQLIQGNKKALSRKTNYLLPSEEITPNFLPTLEVLLTLETSGKWPDDYEAVRRIKAAFYLKLSEELRKLNLVTRVFSTHIDVIQNGYAFQLSIAYQRDIAFLKRVIEDGIIKYRDNKESLELERDTIVLPRLSGALRGLQADQPAFSSTVRLAKRWVASHMLLDYFPETAVEIIVASLFVDAGTYASPGDLEKLVTLPGDLNGPANPQTGFLRFLQLLGNRDWKNLPLVVNFNNELSTEEIAAIETDISSRRAQLPPVILVTPFDKSGCAFTRTGPTPAALARVMILANESLKILENQLVNEVGKATVDIKQVFRPPLEPYDVVIHLKRLAVAKRNFALDANPAKKVKKLFEKDRKTLPVLDYEPVELYLDELRQSFGDKARFFYDNYGGFLIGVMWIDKAWQPADFKVSHVIGCCVDSSSNGQKIVPNLEAICQDFLVLGKGLVKSVQTKTFEWEGHL